MQAKTVIMGEKAKKKIDGRARQERFRNRRRMLKTAAKGTEATPRQLPTTEGLRDEVPEKYGSKQCRCVCCKNNRLLLKPRVVNHWAYKPASELAKNEINRVSMAGDVDYELAIPLNQLTGQGQKG